MHPSLTRTAHRPWPHPPLPYHWRQSWVNVLFAHWRVEADVLRPFVPAPLTVQEFDGTSWIGIVPFRMENVMLRGLPNVPGLSAFPELNVRLYVEHGGKPGVWFLSLDASNRLAVWAARRFFHLPYVWATMRVQEHGDTYVYASERRRGAHPATFSAAYRPTSGVYHAAPGTLAHWLTERYCLYAQAPNGTLLRADVHHHPWPLQQATVTVETNRLLEPYGMALGGRPDCVHFSKCIDVAVWNPEPVAG
jgi:hypothetical protein